MGMPYQSDTTAARSAAGVLADALLKSGPGFVFGASAGGLAVTLYDTSDVTGGKVNANFIAIVPANTTIVLNFPFKNGLVVAAGGPGSVSFQ
jgi:hypothetical protein